MLLNLSIFIWYGAVCPWASFRVNNVIPIYRLIFLGILILLFRRVPTIFALHKRIPEIEHLQQMAFVGFFGPIGVSAIFYLYVSLNFLNQVTVDGRPDSPVREDAGRLQDVMRVVIWFLAICSIVVHGLSVPLGKLGYHLPRTLSSAFSISSERDEPEPFHLRQYIQHDRTDNPSQLRQRRNPKERPPGAILKIGGSAIRSQPNSGVVSPVNEPSRPIKFGIPAHGHAERPEDSQDQSPEDVPRDHSCRVDGLARERLDGSSGEDTAIEPAPKLTEESLGTSVEK